MLVRIVVQQCNTSQNTIQIAYNTVQEENGIIMDRNFAQQLANLQKAANKQAGGGDAPPTTGAASRDAGRSSDRDYNRDHHGSRDYRGQRDRVDSRGGDSSRDNRDYSSRGDTGRDYRDGRGGERGNSGEGGRGQHQYHHSRGGGRTADYHGRGRGRDGTNYYSSDNRYPNQDRKRRRHDDHDGGYYASRDSRDGGRGEGRRDYHSGPPRGRDGGYSGGGGRGSGGGRSYYNNDRRREEGATSTGAATSSSTLYVPLAELVTAVQSKYGNKLKQQQLGNDVVDSAKNEIDTAAALPKETATTTTTTPKRRHIAILILSIDDLPHEHIWKEWVKSSSRDDDSSSSVLVSIIIHAKFPERITSSWMKQRHLIRLPRHVLNGEVNAGEGGDGSKEGVAASAGASPFPAQQQQQPQQDQRQQGASTTEEAKPTTTTFNYAPKFHSRRPDWGSVEITRAMIDLLEEGLRIGSSPCSSSNNTNTTNTANANNDDVKESASVDLRCSYRRYISSPGDSFPENGSSSTTSAGEVVVDDKNNVESKTNSTSKIQSDGDITPVDRFIFVSETCLPVATLDEVEMALFGPREVYDTNESTSTTADKEEEEEEKVQKANNDGNGSDVSATATKATKIQTKKSLKSLYEKSWVNARSTPNNGYSRQQQWDEIRPNDIPPNFVWKADQWIVLTRTHGEAVASLPRNYLNGRYLWTAFRNCRASDEMYFPTALSILGIVRRHPEGLAEVDNLAKGESCAGDQIRRRKITYCDWSMGAKNPAMFTCQEWKEVALKARGEGCLFARKFVPKSSLRGRRQKGVQNSPVVGNDGIVSVEDWLSVIVKKGS